MCCGISIAGRLRGIFGHLRAVRRRKRDECGKCSRPCKVWPTLQGLEGERRFVTAAGGTPFRGVRGAWVTGRQNPHKVICFDVSGGCGWLGGLSSRRAFAWVWTESLAGLPARQVLRGLATEVAGTVQPDTSFGCLLKKYECMTTTLRINIKDMNLQFLKELEEKAGTSAQVEIKVESNKHGEGLFSEEQFWQLIELFDWKQKTRDDIIQPAVIALSRMPVSAIYLFEDFLSEKLFNIDTKEHAKAYIMQGSR